ncbi:MAG: hypothetical protein IPG79_17915 [Saprospiraceae bacterium]|nr:hypothetical protein [Saprospiraceae bacterium]
MNFNYEPVNIYHETKHKINMAGGNSSICDNEGKALAHSNGQIIVNKNNDYIEDTINYSLDIPLNCNDWEYNNSGNAVSAVPSGLLGFQRILLLPLDSVYFVIYNTINKCNSSKIYRTLYSNFKIDENQSSKKLLQKDIVIHNESTISSMHGVRHGNGKDWWIVNFTDGFDSIITMLLSNEGVQYIRKESTGYIKKTDGTIGQIVFSPNGKKLLLYTGNYLFSDTGGGFCIWDFDRCTGKINDIKCIENKQNFIESGVAFSYDSKYFYLANGSHILQFETNEKNLLETKQIVAVFDSFYYIVPGSIHNPIKYSVNFSQLKLGPDGRIYIFPASATQRYLSYMDYPHESFDNVGVRQHAIYMPRLFTRTIPNIPEFRLGPDDNSPCDTLGLDNHPIAKFRYEPDRINYKEYVLPI